MEQFIKKVPDLVDGPGFWFFGGTKALGLRAKLSQLGREAFDEVDVSGCHFLVQERSE